MTMTTTAKWKASGSLPQAQSQEFGTTRSFAFAPPSPCDSFDGEPVSRPDSPTPWARPGGRRRPQTEYRPPTPPLPRERSRSAESGSESLTVVNPNSVSDSATISLFDLSSRLGIEAPKPVRPFPDVRKVPLPTPPPSWSIHDHSVHPSGRSFSPEKVSPTLCSASTATHTPSPSTPHSEKNMSQTSRSMRAMSAKDEQRHRKPSADPVQMPGLAKIERKRLPARPGVLRLTLTRGLSGLKRVSALVASVLSCRP
ncbi:hypothetical protein ID866_7230 [Astraeus odoratus]|nr:hypothetical protein ID866_7230 [Astraeus odoratus]